MITQSELKKYIHYNHKTGVFTKKYCKYKKYIGNTLGIHDKDGYLIFSLKEITYKTHRIAFLYMNGVMPDAEIDHINHIRDDNRWVNLRVATRQDNSKNISVSSKNTSGFVGVYLHTISKCWVSQITVNKRIKHLGHFKNKIDAINARKEANIKYKFHPNHGA